MVKIAAEQRAEKGKDGESGNWEKLRNSLKSP